MAGTVEAVEIPAARPGIESTGAAAVGFLHASYAYTLSNSPVALANASFLDFGSHEGLWQLRGARAGDTGGVSGGAGRFAGTEEEAGMGS